MTSIRSYLVAVILAAVVGSPLLALPPGYTVTDLGTFPGGGSHAYALNEQGHVVGSSFTGQVHVRAHPFFWDGSVMHDLGTFGGAYGAAHGINNAGVVVGFARVDTYRARAFSWTAEGGLVDLGSLSGYSSQAWDINDAGQIVGDAHYSYGDWHAFLWRNGVMTDLGGGKRSRAYAINNAGQIVGGNDGVAVMWHNGTMTEIGRFGFHATSARDVNEVGQVVGFGYSRTQSVVHPFLWQDGTMEDLGTLGGGRAWGWGMNNLGQVVGQSFTDGDEAMNAWVWENGTMVDLNDLLPERWSGLLFNAMDINDQGQIVGRAYLNDNRYEAHAVLLTPVPEPATMGLLAAGLLAVLSRWSPRRRHGNTPCRDNGIRCDATITCVAEKPPRPTPPGAGSPLR